MANLLKESSKNNDGKFLASLNSSQEETLDRYIINEDIEIDGNEISFGIISAYRPVFELKNICSKYKCDVHVVYAHEKEKLCDWEGKPSIGQFSVCIKDDGILYEQKKPDSNNPKEIHEYFSIAWDFTMPPDSVDKKSFFDQNLIGFGFYIKETEDDKKGIPPTLKQWLKLERINAPYGFIGYKDQEENWGDTLTPKEVLTWCRANPDAKEFYIREGVKIIKENSFYKNRQIEKVVFSSTVKIVEARAFWGAAIKQVILNDGVEEFLTSMNPHPGGVFSYCRQLEEIYFPDSVKTIRDTILYGCSNLKKVRFPSDVEFVNSGGFFGIQNPEKGKSKIDDHFRDCEHLQEIKIPDTVDSIVNTAFHDCFELQKVEFGKQVKYVDGSAFEDCINLKEIVIPEENEFFVFENNILFSKDKTKIILCLSNEEKLIIPSGVQKICDHAFTKIQHMPIKEQKQRNPKEIILPDTLQEIEEQAFSYAGIEKIDIPDSVSFIGRYAFNCCFYLTSVKLPENLKVIKENLFKGNHKLSSVYLPANLEEIEVSAFDSCETLKKIIFPKKLKVVDLSAFNGSGIEDFSSLPFDVSLKFGCHDSNISIQKLELKDFYIFEDIVYSADKKQFIRALNRTQKDKFKVLDGVEELDITEVLSRVKFKDLIIPTSVKNITFDEEELDDYVKAYKKGWGNTVGNYIYCSEELFTQFPRKMKKFLKSLSEV